MTELASRLLAADHTTEPSIIVPDPQGVHAEEASRVQRGYPGWVVQNAGVTTMCTPLGAAASNNRFVVAAKKADAQFILFIHK
jgi:hypothetical protein